MKQAIGLIGAALILSACAAPGTDMNSEVAREDSYVPTGSLIARKQVERNASRQYVSGEELQRALQNVPPSGMNP